MDAKLKEHIENVVSDIMINDGPDGHCDGVDIITDYIEAIIEGKTEDWEKKYFKEKKKWFLS